MYIYFALPIISLMLIRSNRVYINYFVFVLLFGLFCGLRGDGVDLDYVNYFNLWFRDYSLNELFVEPIPKIIFGFVNAIGLHFNYSLIIFSVLTLYFIVKSCLYKNLNVAIFFVSYCGYFLLIQNMMQVRISLALSLFLYALVVYEDNKKLSLILLLVSVLTHQSLFILAAFFILIYPFSKKMTLLYYLFFMAIIFQLQSILKLDYLELFLSFIVDLFSNEKLTRYYKIYLLSESQVNVFNMMHLFNLALYFICVFIIVRYKITDRSVLFSINLMSIGIVVFNVFFKLPAFSFRISEMMFFFLPFTLAYCASRLDRISSFIVVSLVFFVSIFSIYKIVFETQYIGSYQTFF